MVQLASTDIQPLQHIMQRMLTPTATSSREWERSLLHSVMDLLGADKASICLPRDGFDYVVENYEDGMFSDYPEQLQPLDRRWNIWERSVGLGAFSRRRLWEPYLQEFYRSPYYNEFVVPNRCFDTLGLAVSTGGAPSATTVAKLMVHHDTRTGPRFTERQLSMLRLLKPAFEAGVLAYLSLNRTAGSLGGVLDSVREALVLTDRRGGTLHENRAFLEVLADERQPHELRGQVRLVAQAMTKLLGEPGAAGPLTRSIITASGSYRLHGSFVEAGALSADIAILVSVDRLGLAWPQPDVLRDRFGLTRREADVALLLGSEGLTNEALGERLFISPHTARHHVERVLTKLGVKRRTEVGPLLLTPAH